MFKTGESPIPGYQLVKFLGQGQYGEVWEAKAPGETRIALKFIALQSKTGSVELKAVQAVKQIRHANLVPITAIWVLDREGVVLDDDSLAKIDTDPGQQTLSAERLDFEKSLAYLVIAMALADESLEERLEACISAGQTGIPLDELIEYMRQAAKGLDFLNEKRHLVNGQTVGIVHRDVKPANLLVIGNSVVVGDFGVATTLREFDATATKLVGSLGFMAPESIARHPSPATDQYALAITYYRLRTGRLPYSETVTLERLFEIHQKGRLEFDHVPPPEQAVLRKATSQDPQARYRSCADFVRALQAEHVDLPAAAVASPAKTVSVVAALVLAVVAAVLLVWQPWRPGGSEQDDTPIVALPTYTMTFIPEDTVFQLSFPDQSDATPIEGTGKANNLTLPEDQRLVVNASSPSRLFDSIDRTYTFAELAETGWNIHLHERSLEDLESETLALLERGDRAEAVILLRGILPLGSDPFHLASPRTINLDSEVIHLAIGRNPAQLAVASVDAARKTVLRFMSVDDVDPSSVPSDLRGVVAMFQSPASGSWFVVSADGIWLWPTELRSQLEKLWPTDESGVDAHLTCAAFSADGKWLMAGDLDGALRYWQVGMDDRLDELDYAETHQDPILYTLFAREGTAFSVSDREVKRLSGLSLASPTPADYVIPPDVQQAGIVEAALVGLEHVAVATDDQVLLSSPVGDQPGFSKLTAASNPLLRGAAKDWLLVSGESPDEYVQLWNVTSSSVAFTRKAIAMESIAAASFSDDGNWLALSSNDGQLSMLELATEPPVWRDLPRAEGGFRKFLAFSGDDRQLISVLDTGHVEIWNLDRCRLIFEATEDVNRP